MKLLFTILLLAGCATAPELQGDYRIAELVNIKETERAGVQKWWVIYKVENDSVSILVPDTAGLRKGSRMPIILIKK